MIICVMKYAKLQSGVESTIFADEIIQVSVHNVAQILTKYPENWQKKNVN